MRKMLISFFVFGLVILASSSALAATTYDLPELGLELTVPSGYSTITRDTPADDPIFRELGTTKSSVISNFQASNMYLNAIAKDYSDEIVVVMTENTIVDDLNLFSDAMMETLASSLINEMSDWGVTATKYDIYEHSQAKFLRVYFAFNDNSVYGVQYYTIYNKKTINFTIRSYTGNLSSTQEYTLKALVDSAIFKTAPLSPESGVDTKSFTYTDNDTGVSFTVPANWTQEPLSKDRETIDVKFVSTKDAGRIICYGSVDFWGQMTDNEKRGYTRKDFNNYIFSVADIAEMYGTTADNVSLVTYNGIQYYKIEATASADMYGLEFSATMTQLVLLDNGWFYLFLFGGTDSQALYADFESLMKSVQYPESPTASADSSVTDIITITAIALLLFAVIIVVVIRKRAEALERKATYNYTSHEETTNHIHPAATNASIYCRKCGQELPADSMFCHICGTKIVKEEQQ